MATGGEHTQCADACKRVMVHASGQPHGGRVTEEIGRISPDALKGLRRCIKTTFGGDDLTFFFEGLDGV